MKGSFNLAKYQIKDVSNVSTIISDSMIHFDREKDGLLNLIRFKNSKTLKKSKKS
jgi:hypothetical protein